MDCSRRKGRSGVVAIFGDRSALGRSLVIEQLSFSLWKEYAIVLGLGLFIESGRNSALRRICFYSNHEKWITTSVYVRIYGC